MAIAIRFAHLDETDDDPPVRVIKPAGTWERQSIACMARPCVWEGLLA